MKKISIVCLTGLLFFAACENTGSSTVGSYEKEETTQSTEKTESGSHSEGAKENTESATGNTSKATKDTTLKVSGDAPQGSSGTEIKTDGNVSGDTTSIKVPK